MRDLVPRELDKTPKLPPWLPPVEEPSEAWVRAYLLGVVCALATPVAATLGELGFLATIYDAAYDVLGGPRQPLGGPRQPEPEGGPRQPEPTLGGRGLAEPEGGPRQPDRPPGPA